MNPGIIGAAGSVLGSVFGGLFGLKSTDSANNANMELAKYKYDRDLEMWNKQNEYNTPAAQMQRFAQAGLNPNLIYGRGEGGNAGSAPEFEAPSIQAYHYNGDFGISNAANIAMNAQANSRAEKMLSAQLAKLAADTTGQELDNLNRTVRNAREYFEYGLRTKYGDQQMLAALENSWQSVRTSQSQQQLNYANASLANAREGLTLSQVDTEKVKRELMKSNMRLNGVQEQKLIADIAYIYANREKIGYEIQQLMAKTDLTEKEATAIILRNNGQWLSNIKAQKDLDVYELDKAVGWTSSFIPRFVVRSSSK